MGFPTILVNNSTGSNTQASGAGPATALTGVDASSDVAGTTITVPNADLTNVATDGTHVLWWDDGAANRNFAKITAKANSGTGTANVTVAPALRGSQSGKTYAIGGKRLSPFHNTERLIKDVLAGWTVDFEHTGTDYALAADGSFPSPASGNTTDGYITFKSSSATRPKLTVAQTFNGSLWYLASASNLKFDHLEFTKTGSATGGGLFTADGSNVVWRDCVFRPPSNAGALTFTNFASGRKAIDCFIYGNGNGTGITDDGTSSSGTIIDNLYLENMSIGILLNGRAVVRRSIVTDCGTAAIKVNNGGSIDLIHNTLVANGGEGVWIAAAAGLQGFSLVYNIIGGNTGAGVKNDSTEALATSMLAHNEKNLYYSNTSGHRTNFPAGTDDLEGTDPQFVGSGDYTPRNPAVIGDVWDHLIGTGSTSWVIPGAVQPKRAQAHARALLGI